MSRRSRTLAAGLLVGALSLGLAGCGSGSGSAAGQGCTPAHQFPTISGGTLTVGVYDLPPFISTQGEGGLSGIDADIVKAVAAAECLEVKANNAGAAAMVPGVQNGRLDVVVGDWYRTQERAAVVNFTDPIYLDDMGLVSADGVATVDGLQQRTVGTVDGYLWVDDLKKMLGDSLKLYPSGTDMQADLKAGRIQAGVDSFGSAVNTVGSDPAFKVVKAQPDPRVRASEQPAQSGFMLPKDNQAMLDAFNADLAKLRADGTIAKILTDHGLEASAAEVGTPRLIG
ncbi:substrate-binding periplasmic protein [Pseudonocardia alni]|uniref:substrate-binding periplasmic protein n=1 Tax=Pseudonocardia alni TaxID=33907 RepID=UPI00332E6AFF